MALAGSIFLMSHMEDLGRARREGMQRIGNARKEGMKALGDKYVISQFFESHGAQQLGAEGLRELIARAQEMLAQKEKAE